MDTRRRFHTRLLGGLAGAWTLMHSTPGTAQADWPRKPVRLIIPMPAGGGVDGVGRALAEKMSVRLGQPVLVDNRPGAATILGTDAVAKAMPDGYTLLLNFSSFVLSPLLYRKVPYDIFKDFAPVALTNYGLLAFAAIASVPAATMPEFLALARAHPGELSYGSSGQGSSGHLYAELLSREAGLRMLHVPYKGAAPMMSDMLGGRVQTGFTTVSDAAPHIRTGQIKVLGVLGSDRMPALPDVATFAESGLRGFEHPAFWGVYAPAGTPEPVLGVLAEAVNHAVAQPDVQARMLATGLRPAGLGPKELALAVRRDYDTYGQLVRELGITLD